MIGDIGAILLILGAIAAVRLVLKPELRVHQRKVGVLLLCGATILFAEAQLHPRNPPSAPAADAEKAPQEDNAAPAAPQASDDAAQASTISAGESRDEDHVRMVCDPLYTGNQPQTVGCAEAELNFWGKYGHDSLYAQTHKADGSRPL